MIVDCTQDCSNKFDSLFVCTTIDVTEQKLPYATLFFAGQTGEDLGQVLLRVDVQQGTTFGEGEDEGRISSRSLTTDVLASPSGSSSQASSVVHIGRSNSYPS